MAGVLRINDLGPFILNVTFDRQGAHEARFCSDRLCRRGAARPRPPKALWFACFAGAGEPRPYHPTLVAGTALD